MSGLSIISGYFAIGNNKEYAIALGYTDESYLTVLASLASLAGAIRFQWSALMDCISYKAVYAMILITQIFANLTMFLVN
jgi:hypothetical protein